MGTINKVGFLKPDGTSVYMDYYEVENYCISEIKKFMDINQENTEKFENYKNKYSYFRPYFDFVVFEMGYIFLNPLLKKSMFGFCDELDLSKKTDAPMLKSLTMNDENLNMRKDQFDFYLSSAITPDDFAFDKNKYLTHKNLLDHILNQILICSKEIYLDYLKHPREGIYLVERLGFMIYGYYESDEISLIYTPYLFTERQRNFYLGLREYYVSDKYYTKNEITKEQKEELDKVIKVYKKII